MRIIKNKIFTLYLINLIALFISAQNTKQSITQSSVLFLAFDNVILDRNIPIVLIHNPKSQKFCIYNSYKSEWIKILGYRFIPQPKLQSPGIIAVNSDIITEEVKVVFEKLKPGDVIYFLVYAKINQILYEIEFGYKIGGEIKNKYIVFKPGSYVNLEIIKE